MSGKGGVGKSALTANLATALTLKGNTVGVVDADINGPTLAKMMGVRDATLGYTPAGVKPARSRKSAQKRPVAPALPIGR